MRSRSSSLAEMIESYLEGDDSNGNGGSSSGDSTDLDARSQIRALSQTCDQLKQDNASLQKDLSSLKNNLQMSMMFPLLLNQKLKVVSDSGANLFPSEQIEFSQADPLTALLPVMMMGGMGGDSDSSGGGMGSMNMMMMVLALSGSL